MTWYVNDFWGNKRESMANEQQKLDVLDEVLTLHLPYTVIDVGWWSQEALSAAPLPSGRTSHWFLERMRIIPGDGNIKCAFTSTADIGPYIARVLADPRTLNQKILCYTDVLTYNEVVDIIEEESGEKTQKIYVRSHAKGFGGRF